MRAAGGASTANQIGYHIRSPCGPAVLPYAWHGIGFILCTLGFGLLTGALPPRPFKAGDWRARWLGVRRAAVSKEYFLKELQWWRACMSWPPVTEVGGATGYRLGAGPPCRHRGLVGMRNVRELEENVAAVDWKLTRRIAPRLIRIMAEGSLDLSTGFPGILVRFTYEGERMASFHNKILRVNLTEAR